MGEREKICQRGEWVREKRSVKQRGEWERERKDLSKG